MSTTGGFPDEELDQALREQGIEPSEHARQLLATAMLQRGIDPNEPVAESLPASLSEPTPPQPPAAPDPVTGLTGPFDDGEPLAEEQMREQTKGFAATPPLRAEPLDLPPATPYADDEETPPEPPSPPPGGISQPGASERFPESILTLYEGELPGEVQAIWGISHESERTARQMIAAWGLDRFLRSELHRQAKYEATREARMNPIRAAFVKAAAEKEKGRKR